MKAVTAAIGLAVCALSFADAALGQDASNPFVRSDTAPAASSPTACDAAFPSALPIRCWAGQQLVMLPKRETFRHYPYDLYDSSGKEFLRVPYGELGGKLVTVTEVRWYDEPIIDLHGWLVRFRVDDTGKEYAVRASLPLADPHADPDKITMLDVALVRDLRAAREKYLGRKYWILRHELIALDDKEIRGVRFKAFTPVTISDVLAGDNSFVPVRLVVKNDQGEEAFIDTAVSRSNGGGGTTAEIGDERLSHTLSSADPRSMFKFSPKVWKALESGDVFVGMTKEQATMSWGEPQTINRTVTAGRTHEQWVYEHGSYLYFEGNVLTAIQN
ncbi:MAG TPA: hypothetical protein VFV07_02010 [Rhizomicrobium sp.]|nr:hypothetical protein [Rhizomicrobium sp.]